MKKEKVNSVYGVVNNYHIIIVVGVYAQKQLDHYNYKIITDENREFVHVSDDKLTPDETYNRLVLGYVKRKYHGVTEWGYYRNKNAKFLSVKMGPSILVTSDNVKLFKNFKYGIDPVKTTRKTKNFNLTMLKNYKFYPDLTFMDIYDQVTNGTMLTVASVEYL